MTKRYRPSKTRDELTALQEWRDYCERMAMRVLTWIRHLKVASSPDIDEETQKKKDYFLYKYYEYQFDLADEHITKLCAYGKN